MSVFTACWRRRRARRTAEATQQAIGKLDNASAELEDQTRRLATQIEVHRNQARAIAPTDRPAALYHLRMAHIQAHTRDVALKNQVNLGTLHDALVQQKANILVADAMRSVANADAGSMAASRIDTLLDKLGDYVAEASDINNALSEPLEGGSAWAVDDDDLVAELDALVATDALEVDLDMSAPRELPAAGAGVGVGAGAGADEDEGADVGADVPLVAGRKREPVAA